MIEYILNRLSMISLIAAGLYFLYEGSSFIKTKTQNPDKVPDNMTVLGVLTIILGIVAIIFGIAHYFFKT